MDKVNEMQDRIKIRLGVDSAYKGPDPACVSASLVGLQAMAHSGPAAGTASCDGDTPIRLAAVGHEFEFLGAPRDYPDCSYCWVIEENDVLMWIVLPRCGNNQNDVTLPF